MSDMHRIHDFSMRFASSSARFAVALLALALAACGGSSSDSGNGGAVAPGTGGIVIGVLTGFGSVRVDDDTFTTDANTLFSIDDTEVADEAAFRTALAAAGGDSGIVVAVSLRSGAAADLSAGVAASIRARTVLKGPVTGTSPLQVLGQDVVVTADTVLANLSGIEQLQTGSVVEVSGFIRAEDNVVLATRIQFKAQGVDEWKLTGQVTSSAASSFAVGAQQVSLATGAMVRDCGAAIPQAGQWVEVKAGPALLDGALAATRVECKAAGLGGELDTPGGSVLPGRIQGFISELDLDAGTMTVGGTASVGQRVVLTPTTVFRDGNRDDLAIGERVQVTGQLNPQTGVLTAVRVSFRQARVRIHATLDHAGGPVDSFELLGVPIQSTALLRDDEGLLSGPALARDVRMRGFVDRAGTVYATRLDDRGQAGREDLRLRGPAREIDSAAEEFSIVGLRVAPVATTVFRDVNDQVIGGTQFFELLAEGAQVQVDRNNPDREILGEINPPTRVELED